MTRIKYLYPHWGSESLRLNDFFEVVNSNQFSGIEINIPEKETFKAQFHKELDLQRQKNTNFILVAQQVFGVVKETPQEYMQKVLKRLESLIDFQPTFINSHTGKDHYSFDDNCRIIEAIENFSLNENIPVYHEIHRGRFTFHSATTLNYLEKFPNLKLVGDLSHWCVVSESMLQDQDKILHRVGSHIYHLHARVGFEQAPQVNNPFAPEWDSYLNQFITWWKQIIEIHYETDAFTITPEFGPFPYMPQKPFSKEPLSIQADVNIQLVNYLKEKIR